MTKANSQRHFQHLVSTSNLSTVSVDELKAVALGVWHEGFTPDVSPLATNLSRRQAAYVLDRLLRYACVPRDRKIELMAVVNDLKLSLEGTPARVCESEAEPLAKKWGVSSDVSQQMAQLLTYQTRHYCHQHTLV